MNARDEPSNERIEIERALRQYGLSADSFTAANLLETYAQTKKWAAIFAAMDSEIHPSDAPLQNSRDSHDR
jgi:hypothetical protein